MQKKASRFFSVLGSGVAGVSIVALVVFLAIDIFLRFFHVSIPKGFEYIKNIVVWLTFVSMLITTNEKKHLSIDIGKQFVKGGIAELVDMIVSFMCVTVSTVIAVSALSFFLSYRPDEKIGVLPAYAVVFIVPLCLIILVVRFIAQAPKKPLLRILASLGVGVGIVLSIKEILFVLQTVGLMFNPENESLFTMYQDMIVAVDAWHVPFMNAFFVPFLVVFIASAFFGTPIFIILGGFAVLFFSRTGTIGGLSSIPLGAYDTLCRNEIPAIPLFTLVGFILSASKAGERYMKFLQTIVGWMPGGVAFVAIIICAVFTTFTGASGVTILALGGLLSSVLINRKYDKAFSHGLITGAGSVGLLFPPSLPVIMYGVASMISIKELYIGGLIPGLLIVLTLIIMGVVYALRHHVERIPFDIREIPKPLLDALWDVLLPIIILIAFFTGIITPVETSAIAVIYVFVIEVFVYKDIKLKEMPSVILKCVPVIGGVLIIIAMASGLQSYIVDEQIPEKLAALCAQYISSPFVFLIILNIVLLITGCIMDIYSAILVVAPLVIPLGDLYGIDKIHLGIIFLSNLMLGFLTPPVGMNLFIASYRFDEPLDRITKYAMPFFLVMLVAVIIITYVPILSTGLVGLFR